MPRVDINAHEARVGPGLDEAWIVNPLARRADPARFDGSAKTAANVRECLIAMPDSAGDLEERVATARAAGAPAIVRICPGADGHGYPLESWAVSPIPEFCEREDLALAVDFGSLPAYPWSELVAFARAYPRMPMVALGAPLDGPAAGRAFDATPNLILDTSRVEAEASLPTLASLAKGRGAYRLAYGSGARGLGADKIAAILSPSDAEMVLSGTAARLANGTWGVEFL
jgi:hypothetical protein